MRNELKLTLLGAPKKFSTISACYTGMIEIMRRSKILIFYWPIKYSAHDNANVFYLNRVLLLLLLFYGSSVCFEG